MDKPDIKIQNSETSKLVSTLPNQHMFFGFPYGGAMDSNTASQANYILKQSPSTLLIECTLRAPMLIFNTSIKLAITGADMDWKLDGKEMPSYQSIIVKPGQILSGKYTKTGLRAYLAFNKNLIEWKGDQIFLGKKNKRCTEEIKLKDELEVSNSLIIHRGPEWNLLSQEGKSHMISYQGQLSQDMNRMGAYLKGPTITLKEKAPTRSVCTFPGVIQLLPNGQLIVLLQDAQTTGGYPRIAYLNNAQLNLFNQLLPGYKIKWRLMF